MVENKVENGIVLSFKQGDKDQDRWLALHGGCLEKRKHTQFSFQCCTMHQVYRKCTHITPAWILLKLNASVSLEGGLGSDTLLGVEHYDARG